MARWDGDREERIFGEGNRYEDMRQRGGGEWRGGRGADDRRRERWSGGGRDEWRGGGREEEWRGGRGEEWRGGGERWSGAGETPEYGGFGGRGREWEERRGGGRDEWERDREGMRDPGRPRERYGHMMGERWDAMGEGGPSFGAGGMYGGAGGRYGGSWGEPGGLRRGGSGLGMGDYAGYGDRGEWRGEGGGWRDTSRDWGRDLRRHGGEDEGFFDRMREGWRKMTGRGPKGYKRSDERIREEVSERIARSGVDASDVEVKVESGEVTLTGLVESRHHKRMLEDMADDVFGVDEVNNHLRIRREDRQSQTFTAGQSQAAQGTQGATGRGTQGMQGQAHGSPPQPGRH